MYDFNNSDQVVLLERSQFVPQNLGINFQKWEKIKHCVSSPPTKYGGTFFIKKFCIGEQTFLGNFFFFGGGCFTWGLMISCKIFFQLMVTVFKEKRNLQLPLIFYSSIRFVFDTAFISEQVAENRFGALLEISVKFITKFNVFSCMILQFRLKTAWKISKS